MRLFLFAIGGTGSRVLKSLVMLSAAGVRPLDEDGKPLKDLEIVPVIIDPHKANEDLKRTESLLNDYRDIRRKLYGNDPNGDAERHVHLQPGSRRECQVPRVHRL